MDIIKLKANFHSNQKDFHSLQKKMLNDEYNYFNFYK